MSKIKWKLIRTISGSINKDLMLKEYKSEDDEYLEKYEIIYIPEDLVLWESEGNWKNFLYDNGRGVYDNTFFFYEKYDKDKLNGIIEKVKNKKKKYKKEKVFTIKKEVSFHGFAERIWKIPAKSFEEAESKIDDYDYKETEIDRDYN